MQQHTPILEVKRLSKSYAGLTALDDVSFDVGRGAIVGLMGANGAGKTTLFSIVAGNASASGGDVLLDGRSLIGERPDRICRRGIARTFQIVKPFGGLSVIENATIAAIFGSAERLSQKQATQRAIDALEALDLIEFRAVKACDLTLARQKKLEVARAVATGAKILMLDEVMAGLTAAEVNRMIEIIQHLNTHSKLTIIIVEHVMQALMRLSEKVVVLHLGKVVAEGTPEAIAANRKVQQIYFGRAG